jgi:hypothetical protein
MSGSCAVAITGLDTADKVRVMADTHERAGRSLGNFFSLAEWVEADESARISGKLSDK